MIRWVETFESNSSPSSRNSSGKKRRRKRKERRSRMIEECYVNEESAGSRRVWLTIHRRFGRGTRGILPSWKERALVARSDSTRQSELQACTYLPSPLPTFNTAFNAARPLYFTRRTQSSLSPPSFVVDLCVCSRKIKLSHYRATAVDRSLFWRQEV